PPAATAAPAAPSAVMVSADTPGELVVTWTDNSNDVASEEQGFNIMRGTSAAGPFTKVGSVGTNVTRFADIVTSAGGTVTPGTAYFYEVQAFNGIGQNTSSDTPGTGTATDDKGPINFNNFADTTGFQLNGNTVVDSSNNLQLTDAVNGQAGS